MRNRTARRLRLAAPLGALTLVASLQAAGRPSFDCGRASTWTERTICNDDALAAADREMSAAFSRRRASVNDDGQRRHLLAEQRRWLGRRDECRTAPAPTSCLAQRYVERIGTVGGRHEPSAPPAAVESPTPAEAPPGEPRSGAAGAWAVCHTGGEDAADGLCLDRLLAAATTAFGDAEAAMLKRLAGADGTPPNAAAAEAFRASQDAFLRFRDATCRWRGAAAAHGTESVRQACLVDYTRARTAEISAARR
jgi:uncharacterized protein